ncbi:MAG: zinc-ribbon domain containing protein [Chloroflexota bacterium]
MNFQDKSIQCSDCGDTFTFSAKEQGLFVSRGYINEPKRCSWCRAARKIERQGDGDYGHRSRSWR